MFNNIKQGCIEHAIKSVIKWTNELYPVSKEDLENSNDADEPFLNEVIAKPEIDELFEPKILVNARRYDNSNRGGTKRPLYLMMTI